MTALGLPGLSRTNATMPVFGNTPSANPPRPSTGPSLFASAPGAPGGNPAPATGGGGGLFGTTPTPGGAGSTANAPSAGGGLFGNTAAAGGGPGGTANPAPAAPSGGLFGVPNPAPAPAPSLFGNPGAATGGAGGGGLFGGNNSQPKPLGTGLFGNAPS